MYLVKLRKFFCWLEKAECKKNITEKMPKFFFGWENSDEKKLFTEKSPKNGVRIVVGGEKSDVKKLLLKKCLKNWFWLGKPGCKKLLTEKKWLKNCQGCWGKAGCKINRIKGPRSPFHSFIALFSGKIELGTRKVVQ